MLPDCRKHLRHVLTIMPTARDVQEFLRDMDGNSRRQAPETESFGDLIEKVERNGAFANEPTRFPNPACPRGAGRGRGPGAASTRPGRASRWRRSAGTRASRTPSCSTRDGAIIADFTYPDRPLQGAVRPSWS